MFVRTHGLEIAYDRVGTGPPLVLVHGAAEDARIWRPQLDALADEFTVVAWDEPGAGRSSDLPPDFSLADYADCLAALLDALALGPAHVAGLSWGGTVVLELYRRRPELVATLVLVDTYAGWKGSLPAEEVRDRVAGMRRMLAAGPGEFDPTLPGLFAADPPAEFVPLLAEIAADVRPESLASALSVMAEADQRDVLPRIAVPTLLVWGELDVRSPLRVAHRFEEAIPGAQLVVIPGAGHLSHLERPDDFNRAVREFCRAQPTIRPCRDDEREAILAIVNAGAEAYRGVIPADRWQEPYMSADELAGDIAAGVEFWGYEADGALLGVMGIQRLRDVDLIRHAYVLPAAQRRGVGGTLLEYLMRGAEQQLLVGTWAAAEWAIRFYERHGFERVPGRRKDELLREHWGIPERQIATSVVLAKPRTSHRYVP